jgi:hypothetical protein
MYLILAVFHVDHTVAMTHSSYQALAIDAKIATLNQKRIFVFIAFILDNIFKI